MMATYENLNSASERTISASDYNPVDLIIDGKKILPETKFEHVKGTLPVKKGGTGITDLSGGKLIASANHGKFLEEIDVPVEIFKDVNRVVNNFDNLVNNTNKIENNLKSQFDLVKGNRIVLDNTSEGKISNVILYGKSEQEQSPSPDSPQEIRSVVNPKIEVCKNNLVDVIDTTVTELTCVGGLDTKNVNRTVYISFNYNNASSINGIFEVVDDLNNPITSKTLTANSQGKVLLEVDVIDLDVVRFVFKGDGSEYSYNYTNFMASFSNTDYEPYSEISASLPYTLNAIPVSSGGNVVINGQEYIADYVDIENKKLVRMVGGGRMYGSSNGWEWLLRSSGTEYYANSHPYKTIFKNTVNTIAISNAFASGAVWGDNCKNKIAVSNSEVPYVFVGATSFNTLDDLKSYLDTNEVYVYSELAILATIDLTDEEVQAFKELPTYNQNTNVFVSSDQVEGYAEFSYPTTDAAGLVSINTIELEKLKKTVNTNNTNIAQAINLTNESVRRNSEEINNVKNSIVTYTPGTGIQIVDGVISCTFEDVNNKSF